MIYFSKAKVIGSKPSEMPIFKKKSFGFSLIELMVGIAVLAILLSIAVPSFRTMIINSQVRNAAESIANGLQKARAEAVARNTNVTFVLGAGANTSWTVNQVAPAVVIESRDSGEGSANVTRTPVGVATVTFNNFGRVVDATPVAQVDLTATATTKSLRVTIGLGGDTRMCDPNLTSGSSPRAC